MMGDIHIISDTHLGHKNILTFLNPDGTPLRGGFDDITHHDETIYEQWQLNVSPKDVVYHLGDVAFTKAALLRIADLPGRKRLIRGNHDLFKLSTYRKIFQEIYGVRQLNGYWLTHVPMWEGSVAGERVKGNIHGHLHGYIIDHPKYFNACVEHIDYTPVALDLIAEWIAQRNS